MARHNPQKIGSHLHLKNGGGAALVSGSSIPISTLICAAISMAKNESYKGI